MSAQLLMPKGRSRHAMLFRARGGPAATWSALRQAVLSETAISAPLRSRVWGPNLWLQTSGLRIGDPARPLLPIGCRLRSVPGPLYFWSAAEVSAVRPFSIRAASCVGSRF